MNKKYICSYNPNHETVFYTYDRNGNKVVISRNIHNIAKNIMNLMTHNYIIKIDYNKDRLILQETNKNITLVINNSEAFLNEPILFSIKNDLIDKITKDGYINITEVESLHIKPKKNNKYKDFIIRRVVPIVAGIGIVITSIAAVNSKKARAETNKPTSEIVIINPRTDEPHIMHTIDIKPDIEIPKTTNYDLINIVHTAPAEEPTIEEPVEEVQEVYLPFDDESESEKAVSTRENYYSIIEKYSKKYGLDPNLVLSIATQERGTHASNIDPGGGIGLMQIQYDIWIGASINYYELNEETNTFEYKTIDKVTDDMLENLETNIQMGCMILQQCLRDANYNIPMAIQMYNIGLGTIYNIVDKYAEETGRSRSDIINDPTDLGWLKYRPANFGDNKYLENVNRWADDNIFTVTNVKTNEDVSIRFTNENEEARRSR